jgi:PhnB protein
MQSRLNAYLHFQDTAREAMEFYKSVFGGKLQMSTFKDYGAAQVPSDENKIMHSMLEAENGISFMGADAPSGMPLSQGTTSLALSGDNEAELTGYFEKLAAGGTVREPLVKAPWGDAFGMLTDKYGVEWMVNITEQKS